MSDYLTRLAWRALGLIPSAQPRVLSRFADGADAQFELPPERWDDNRPPERIPILEDPEPPAPAAPVAPTPPPAARRPAAAAPAPPRAAEPSAPSAPGGGEENLANATNPETVEPAVEAPAAEPVQEPGPAEWGEQIAERAASEVTVGSPFSFPHAPALTPERAPALSPADVALPSLSESFPVSFPEGFQEGSEVAPHRRRKAWGFNPRYGGGVTSASCRDAGGSVGRRGGTPWDIGTWGAATRSLLSWG
jgi:hypothetical protein